ncbi:ATP-binding protein [Salmonella enterica subsp. enterica serovar Kentucky]|nr:ATP-binding protein [Salmonella enterica subsp. enterica serovar Kentucky]
MAKTLEQNEKQVHVADIVRHGEKLIVPDGMKLSDVLDLVKRRMTFEEEEVVVRRTYNVFPWDGAHALMLALTERYGWAAAEATPGFFGSNPPQMLDVQVGYGQTKKVPWGRFSLPQVEGFVQCSAQKKDGRVSFELVGKVLRKDEPTIELLFDTVEKTLRTNSIYMGKAIKIRFRDNDGDLLEMPEPEFMNLNGISRDSLVYSDDVQNLIETNLFTPIERVSDCIANDMPVKRGVLLGGPYGTGKTMAATVAAALATNVGVTYVYVPRSDELSDAIQFAKQYSDKACVIFCEDIDRAVSGERSVKMDDILNILDGIDTKSSRIITVLTTNHLENINPAMLRPGRLDAIIDVTAPDAKAVEKLVRLYGKDTIAADADLTLVGEALAGTIPAVIAEVVKRAKLHQLQYQEPGTLIEQISSQALLDSALTIQAQRKLLEEQSKPKVKEPTFNEVIAAAVAPAIAEGVKRIASDVSEMHEHVVG